MSKPVTGYQKAPTAIGQKLKNKFAIFDIDICQESYSATVDFGRELTNAQINALEHEGFSVIHERDSIYTLSYEA